jgi:hypothetical protein
LPTLTSGIGEEKQSRTYSATNQKLTTKQNNRLAKERPIKRIFIKIIDGWLSTSGHPIILGRASGLW